MIDLADFSSVVSFADGLKDTPIDILVPNAGLAFWDHKVTKDGWEDMWVSELLSGVPRFLIACRLQVNHLDTSLASLLLSSNLVRAAKEKHTTSRMVVTASETHMFTTIDELVVTPEVLKSLNDPEHYTPKDMEARYPLTKRKLENIRS